MTLPACMVCSCSLSVRPIMNSTPNTRSHTFHSLSDHTAIFCLREEIKRSM